MQTGFNFIYEKLFDDATKTSPKLSSFFPVTKGAEIFYTVKDGKWSDLNVWETVSGRVNKLPTASDNIYIKHRVLTNVSSVTVNDMYIASTGTLMYDDWVALRIVNVLGNLTSYGIINGISSTGFGLLLKLYGRDTVIKQYLYSGDTNGGIEYAGNSDQYIAPIQYRNLYLSGSGKKYLTGNLIVDYRTDLLGTGTLELLGYDFTSGTNGVNMSCSLSKMYTSGKVLFRSTLNLLNGGVNTLDFSAGNPDVECWNGITHSNGFNGAVRFKSGTGTWRFTTNNQSILDSNANGVLPFMGNIYVDSGLTLTIGLGSGTYITTILYGQTIAGNSLSKIIMKDRIYFATATAADNFMTGALTDFNTFNGTQNILGYIFNGNANILYNTLGGLYITGTGTKSLTANTTLAGVLDMNTTGVNGNPTGIQLSTYNITVNSTSTIGAYNVIYKSGSGNILFVGNLVVNGANQLQLSTSTEVECRNGFYIFNSNQTHTVNGNWTFTTNSQTIYTNYGTTIFSGNWLISGAITVTNNDSYENSIRLDGTLNGTVAGSTFVNKTNTTNGGFIINSTNSMMTTGVFDCTSFANIVSYIHPSNFTLQFQNYWRLRIDGTGTKTLPSGTNIITGSLTIGGNTYLSKPDSGTLIIGELFEIATQNGFTCGASTVIELRGGIRLNNSGGLNTNISNGIWSCTTTNQSITALYGCLIFDVPITISGAITVTLNSPTYGGSGFIANAPINGNNANSILLLVGNTNYRSATAPMVTGKLYANQAANKWIYDAAGNQDITVPQDPTSPGYKDLTLAGSGAKRLLGNVSVKGTYTLTAPATLDNNGFSLTNP